MTSQRLLTGPACRLSSAAQTESSYTQSSLNSAIILPTGSACDAAPVESGVCSLGKKHCQHLPERGGADIGPKKEDMQDDPQEQG